MACELHSLSSCRYLCVCQIEQRCKLVWDCLMIAPVFGFRGSPSIGIRFCSNGVCSLTYMFES